MSILQRLLGAIAPKKDPTTTQQGFAPIPQNAIPPNAAYFNGKTTTPGVVIINGKPLELLLVKNLGYFDVYFVRIDGRIYKVPSSGYGNRIKVQSMPQEIKNKIYVDANQNDHQLNQNPEQKALIHGIDLSDPISGSGLESATENLSWHKNLAGQEMIRKGDAAGPGYYIPTRQPDGSILPQKMDHSTVYGEVAFYNLAKSVFGLGHYVPTTAAFVSPIDGKLNSVMEKVHNAENIAFPSEDKFKTHIEILKNLGDSGELDKLAIMDYILGNRDRHAGNFMFDLKKKTIYLIDHGYAHDHLSGTSIPSYLRFYLLDKQGGEVPKSMRYQINSNKFLEQHKGILDAEMNPAALNWINSLSVEKLQQEYSAHNEISPAISNEGVSRLKTLQDKVKSGIKNYSGLIGDQVKSEHGPFGVEDSKAQWLKDQVREKHTPEKPQFSESQAQRSMEQTSK